MHAATEPVAGDPQMASGARQARREPVEPFEIRRLSKDGPTVFSSVALSAMTSEGVRIDERLDRLSWPHHWSSRTTQFQGSYWRG
jgi:hypothetical protein